MTYLIIPTYNESENIEELIKEIHSLNISDLKIVIVDDGSPDGTADIVEKMGDKYKVEIIKRPGKLGLGSAYIEGFKYAMSKNADIVMEMDADFSHNPKDIPNLINGVKEGFDLCIGSRKIKGGGCVGWSFRRRFMSDSAMSFTRFILGIKTKDVTAGFRAYNTKVFETINLDNIKSNGYAFQEELVYLLEKNKFKIKETPVIFVDRRKGESKLGVKDIIEFFINIFRMKFKF